MTLWGKNVYAVHQRLAAWARPFERRSAYGSCHVSRVHATGGESGEVYGLAERSKQRANVGEVEGALNRAHRDATVSALRIADASAAAVLLHVARLIVPDEFHTEAVLETAATLVGDSLGIGSKDGGADVFSSVYYGLANGWELADKLSVLADTAVALSSEEVAA